MKYQVIINIPEHYNEYIRSMENFEQFVSNATIEALKAENNITDKRKKRLSDAAKLMLNEYTEDKELTCFTALDGEPVYE